MFDIILPGTAGVMPMPNRWLASLLLRHNGRMILIDCGEGTQISLKMIGWGFKAIDAILFTHYHGDHIAGLPGLLLTLGNSGRTEPVTMIGPAGLTDVVKGLTVIAPELPFEIKFIELSHSEINEAQISELNVKSIPVDHTLPCFSYSIELKRQRKFDKHKADQLGVPISLRSALQRGESVKVADKLITSDMVLGEKRKGIKLSYVTDTRPTDILIDFIKNSDLFVCEGMYGSDEYKEKAIEKKHMTFNEAGLLAKKGNVKELCLTHYSPSLKDPKEYIEDVKSIFPNTVPGYDLIKFTLQF